MSNFWAQFGGKITKEWSSIYTNSKNWKNGKFENYEPTQLGVDWKKIPRIIYKQLKGQSESYPNKPLPIADFDTAAFMKALSCNPFPS